MFGSPAEYEKSLSVALTDYGVNSLLVPFEHYKDADIDGIVSILEKVDSISGIIFLGDHDVVSGEQSELEAIADTNSMRLLFSVLKAISTHSRKNKNIKRIRLIRATRYAYQVSDEDDSFDIRKSVSTGFLRTARVEFPLLDIRQIDFGNSDAASTAAYLRTELDSPASVAVDGPETLYHNGKRLSLMFEPAVFDESLEREKVFNKDKVFWVIGGTSGVGRLLAQHLAGNYQASLALSGSRRLPPVEEYDQYLADNDDGISATITLIRELEAMGSNVIYVSTDVRSADSMRVSLDIIRLTYKTLDGVYFSALQLDDMMIVQKEWPGYRNMMDMRVYGLHELIHQLKPDELDFFVMFSSCTGLTGNVGQSDYSASDVYMDCIPFQNYGSNQCRFKTIQWGPWSLGQQVSDIVLDHINRNGLIHVTPDGGMAALEKLILSDAKSVAYVPGSIGAHALAKNLFGLRQGVGLRAKKKPKTISSDVAATSDASNANVAANLTTNAVTNSEEQLMSNPQAKQNLQIDGNQMNMLMQEFEKQREMFMKLCENQNALLSGSLDGLSADYVSAVPVATIAPVTPPPVVQAAPVAPVVEAVAPIPAPVAETAPVVEVPVVAEPAVANAAPATPQGRPENLFDFVASLMARAVEMHVDDIDPDQNIMELGEWHVRLRCMWTISIPTKTLWSSVLIR
jgi:NADP-dependent 3-hydroxy acid dehydrogenase YdfG